ncbi:MAG TPA: hypothetical protein VL485_05395 [Ktedonobacteraceae bacterium]|nr:hypothetical protein [Ktedonobacteraceae bacterium]
MPTSYPDETRSHYLDALLASSSTLHFPIRSGQHHLPLQTIFQPLTLRHGPFSFEGSNHTTSFQGETEGTMI